MKMVKGLTTEQFKEALVRVKVRHKSDVDDEVKENEMPKNGAQVGTGMAQTKTYEIGQLLVQTDWYRIEAETEEEALKKYCENPGEAEPIGSTGGWSGPKDKDVFIRETKGGDKDGKKTDNSET